MGFEEQDEQTSQFSTGLSPWVKIFFGAVVLCAVFFALGYTFGRSSAPIPNTTLTSDPQLVTNASADKPSAAQSQTSSPTPTQNTAQNVPSQQSDLTFYKSVEHKPDAQLTPPQAQTNDTKHAQATATTATSPTCEMPNIKVVGT